MFQVYLLLLFILTNNQMNHSCHTFRQFLNLPLLPQQFIQVLFFLSTFSKIFLGFFSLLFLPSLFQNLVFRQEKRFFLFDQLCCPLNPLRIHLSYIIFHLYLLLCHLVYLVLARSLTLLIIQIFLRLLKLVSQPKNGQYLLLKKEDL